MIAKDGRNPQRIISSAVNLPANQIIMVVTSPTGEKAPPALAATTIAPAATKRLCPLKNLRAI